MYTNYLLKHISFSKIVYAVSNFFQKYQGETSQEEWPKDIPMNFAAEVQRGVARMHTLLKYKQGRVTKGCAVAHEWKNLLVNCFNSFKMFLKSALVFRRFSYYIVV